MPLRRRDTPYCVSRFLFRGRRYRFFLWSLRSRLPSIYFVQKCRWSFECLLLSSWGITEHIVYIFVEIFRVIWFKISGIYGEKVQILLQSVITSVEEVKEEHRRVVTQDILLFVTDVRVPSLYLVSWYPVVDTGGSVLYAVVSSDRNGPRGILNGDRTNRFTLRRTVLPFIRFARDLSLGS